MDLSPNKVLCEACGHPVNHQDFAVCVSCKAPYHPECRRERSTCPTFQCQGISSMTGAEYVAGVGRELPADTEARVQALVARRASLAQEYAGKNGWMTALGAVFFGIGTLFALAVGLTTLAGTTVFAAVVILGLAIAGAIWWMSASGSRVLSQIALIDLELDALGRNWDGSAKPPGAAPKAA